MTLLTKLEIIVSIVCNIVHKLFSMIKFFNKILNVGLDHKTNAEELLRIKLINQVIVVGFLLSLINTILNLFKQEWPDVIAGGIILTVFGLVYFLVIKKKHFWARILLLTFLITIISVVQILYGTTLKLEPIYLVFLIISIIVFSSAKGRTLSITFVLGMYLATQYFTRHVDPIFAEKVSGFANVNYFIFSVLLIAWIVYTLFDVHKTQSSQLIQQSKNLKSVLFSSAHNMRTPVHNVNNFSQLIEKKIEKKEFDADLNDYLGIMKDSSRNVIGVLDNLQSNIETEFDNKYPDQ